MELDRIYKTRIWLTAINPEPELSHLRTARCWGTDATTALSQGHIVAARDGEQIKKLHRALLVGGETFGSLLVDGETFGRVGGRPP